MSNIDWSLLRTAEQIDAEEKQSAYESALRQRQAAYAAESDPLKTEAEYDAAVSGEAPDYTDWIKKVQEIKERFPLPN